MADNTLALQVRPTEFGNNFNAGFNNGLNQQALKQQQASAALAEKQKSMQALYMVSAGVLRDGEASPEEWDGVVAMMEQNGADPAFVEKLRGNPEMAKVLAMGSGEALKFSQDERQMDLQMQKLAADIDAAAQDRELRTRQLDQGDAELEWKKNQPIAVSPGETLVDPNTNQPKFTGPPKPADPTDVFDNEQKLFQQYSNSDPVKAYETVKSAYERVRASVEQKSGAGDLALIYGFMRMLDPGSVVRESEFAMAATAGDFGERVQGAMTMVLNGERLPDTQRKEFLAAAEAIYADTADNLSGINSQFSERAKAGQVDPTRFIREPEAYEPLGGGSVTDGNKVPSGAGDYDWTDYF